MNANSTTSSPCTLPPPFTKTRIHLVNTHLVAASMYFKLLARAAARLIKALPSSSFLLLPKSPAYAPESQPAISESSPDSCASLAPRSPFCCKLPPLLHRRGPSRFLSAEGCSLDEHRLFPWPGVSLRLPSTTGCQWPCGWLGPIGRHSVPFTIDRTEPTVPTATRQLRQGTRNA